MNFTSYACEKILKMSVEHHNEIIGNKQFGWKQRRLIHFPSNYLFTLIAYVGSRHTDPAGQSSHPVKPLFPLVVVPDGHLTGRREGTLQK